MSNHDQAHDGAEEHHGSSVRTYLAIAVVLAMFTLIEYYLPQVMEHGAALIIGLLLLAFVKAGLVMAFYMHLKFDSRVYTGVMALAVILVLYFLVFLAVPI